MYTFCIVMIVIASILLILAVLVQSPKSGMAANFGAANQTMGVRQTTDFLEKFTWAMVAAIVLSVIALPKSNGQQTIAGLDEIDAAIEEATVVTEQTVTVGEDGLVVDADAEGAEVVVETTDEATDSAE